MLPLSFAEYCSAFPEEHNTPKLYARYLLNSSFPGALEFTDSKDIRAYLEGIYNTILVKDVALRKKVSDISQLQSLIEFMYDNIGNIASSAKIANTLTSMGRKISVPTVESYISALTSSFILYRAERYDVKGKERLKNSAKYYAADMGLRYFLLGSKQSDSGHILENIVYLELLRRGYEVYVGRVGQSEVDFIVLRDGLTTYIQVSQSILDTHTRDRELAPLLAIHDHNPKIILSMDYLPMASYNGIRQVNVYDWLLGEK